MIPCRKCQSPFDPNLAELCDGMCGDCYNTQRNEEWIAELKQRKQKKPRTVTFGGKRIETKSS